MTPNSPTKNNLLFLFSFTVLTAYFHVFMEWLFFVTKPSTLSVLSLYEKLKALVVSGGVIAFILLILFSIFLIPARKWKSIGYVPSALMLSISALILLDNFTYTLFKLGITSTLEGWRIIYTVAFILIFIWMFRYAQRTAPTLKKSASFLTFGLLAVSLTGILAIYNSRAPYYSGFKIKPQKTSAERPNIIILGADGLSASYLSAYGSELETTPFIDQLVKKSLVAENAFPNASSTTASTTSTLTGKEPAEVGVYRYPDILTDEDSFEHLPGILKHQGYLTVEIGAPNYVDATKLNLIDGFDIVNNHSVKQPALDALRSVLGNSPSTYFIQTITERITERLLHIFFIQDMVNPFEQVNNPKSRMTDTQRMDQIMDLLEHSERPLFVFSHFMDTHGPVFSSEKNGGLMETTPAGKEPKWDVKLYQKSIQSFDKHVQELFTYLAESGKLDNTIVVIYTDHGFKYVTNQRIPIIIHFPNNEHNGKFKNNAQIIDIPVTLLDYLGIAKPEWMTGASMLSTEVPADRKIISITAGSPKKIKPPFYQIKIVQVIVCQKWYALNVQDNTFESGLIANHTAPCEDKPLPSVEEIHPLMLEYLQSYGYDVDSIK
ncbi:MAG: sulfatase-like hydrolase/transferase [Anaerolineales bacterium]|nr:sulfatase-like hydrolase/transferase [Anaerolineales bacterium]